LVHFRFLTQPRPTSPLPHAGPPGLPLSSLADMRAPPGRLPPRPTVAAAQRRLRSRNGRSTYSSSLPTTTPVDSLPKRPPSFHYGTPPTPPVLLRHSAAPLPLRPYKRARSSPLLTVLIPSLRGVPVFLCGAARQVPLTILRPLLSLSIM
jgi:hypothetical protein